MGSDAAAANASGAAASKDLGGKRKKANRAAKLKQCKLDARREQWLSQVKNRSCKVVTLHASPSPASPLPLTLPQMEKQTEPLEMSRTDGDDRPMIFHATDLESEKKSDSSHNQSLSVGADSKQSSGTNREPYEDEHEEDKDGDEEVSVEEDGDGCLDDWEAVADTLTSSDDTIPVPIVRKDDAISDDGILRKPEPERRSPRAWRSDDVSRPQSLPNLRNQHSLSLNSAWYRSQRTVSWAHHGITSQPSACPICYEDLDSTDSSFQPCGCGFRLCLFCHKRILEADCRCPGCRKLYSPLSNGDIGVRGGVPLLSLQLPRSFSMSSRS